MKLLLIAFLACASVGCDNPGCWEFSAVVPKGATVSELMDCENILKSNGYKRVDIDLSCSGSYFIRATRTDPKSKEVAR
jgi:hypothetical protein